MMQGVKPIRLNGVAKASPLGGGLEGAASNFDTIRQYVSEETKTITLDEKQQELLRRWNYYISLKLAGELKTGEIVKKMMEEFSIERATVFNDMGNAEALFGYSSTLNKRFRMGARIDFLEEKLKYLWSDEVKEYDIASKLEGVLQKYYDAFPELKPDRSPRKIVYNITKNEYNNPEKLMPLQDAEKLIEDYLKI